jgi:OOP family OmpA-OmpF porin
MKNFRLLQLAALATLAGAGAVPSAALAAENTAPYVGVSVGRSTAQINEQRLVGGLLGPSTTLATISSDDRDTNYRVFAGYPFNRILGIELGLFRLGSFSYAATTAPAGAVDGRVAVKGVDIDLVATLPLSERWDALGRVGAQFARSRHSYAGSGALSAVNGSTSRRKTEAKFGVGLQYAFSPGFLMRAEAERYRISDGADDRGHVNVVSVSAVFPFGGASPRMAQAARRPVEMQPTSPPIVMTQATPAVERPAPVIVVAPEPAPVVAPPAPRRVSFSTEALFGFDVATVSPQGHSALDRFAEQIEGTRYDTVSVEGHTDRLGSTAYNQTLSLQRAEAVKRYLAANGRVEGMKITATGKGESTPVTRLADCPGERANSALIACLQPDRRVEVELSGQR